MASEARCLYIHVAEQNKNTGLNKGLSRAMMPVRGRGRAGGARARACTPSRDTRWCSSADWASRAP